MPDELIPAPADAALLHVNEQLVIPRAELDYRATRSGGPGGQHVNTSSTRIELTWNVRSSAALSDQQRERLLARLAARLDGEGNLRVVSAARRSQLQNREAATERLAQLIAVALREPKPRRRTRVPKQEKEARLRAKKLRGETKKGRGRISTDE